MWRELFTRIASVSFERVMKNEIEATNSIQEATGQLAHNSSLISEHACTLGPVIYTYFWPFLRPPNSIMCIIE